jgi:hypothetical protein
MKGPAGFGVFFLGLFLRLSAGVKAIPTRRGVFDFLELKFLSVTIPHLQRGAEGEAK